MSNVSLPFAIYHEHPHWFKPLFAELDRRGLPYVRLDPRSQCFDPSEQKPKYSLVFNRMSPSAYLRGGLQGIFFTHAYMAHLDRLGIPVVNGRKTFLHETSKALQLTVLQSLGLPYPRTRVINHASQATVAAEGLRFPVVVKANVGGSGAGIVRFNRPADLAHAAAEGGLNFGVDHTALVQEFIPARGNLITRIETLGGEYLYGIKILSKGDSFNLCPADICQRSDGAELVRTACPVDAPRTGLKVEGFRPAPEVIDAVERIAVAMGIDVGGIEYMIDDRDGRMYFYDVNALSNFVADAMNVIGFDPHARLVNYLEQRALPRPEGRGEGRKPPEGGSERVVPQPPPGGF
jgi:glutathione synthase/RimK-type ligase-like ATP-grasp enzyme